MKISNFFALLSLLPLTFGCSSKAAEVLAEGVDGDGFEVDGDLDGDGVRDDEGDDEGSDEAPPCDAGLLGVTACSQIDWTVDGSSFSTDLLNDQQDLDFAFGILAGGQLAMSGVQLSQFSTDSISISVAVTSEGTFVAEAGDVRYRREVGDVEEIFSNLDGTFSVVVANVRDDRVDGSFVGPLVSETDGRVVQAVGTFALVCCDTQ